MSLKNFPIPSSSALEKLSFDFLKLIIFLLIYFNWRIIILHTVFSIHRHMVFAIHRHESAMGAHVSAHPSGLSQSTSFECPASCTELALVIYFTHGNIHVSMLISQIIPLCWPSPTESKNPFFTSVALSILHIGRLFPSF